MLELDSASVKWLVADSQSREGTTADTVAPSKPDVSSAAFPLLMVANESAASSAKAAERVERIAESLLRAVEALGSGVSNAQGSVTVMVNRDRSGRISGFTMSPEGE